MSVVLHTLPGIPCVERGDDLASLISDGLGRAGIAPRDGDIFVLAQKIVSKAEGRLVDLATVVPSERALQLARRTEKDPRVVELVLSEATSIVLAKPGMLLVEHRLGFVMPNAGIDLSNIGPPGHDMALLLPVNPDASAEMLRDCICAEFGAQVAVVINDTVSRAWRNGACGVAIGSAGLPVLDDLRGRTDIFGRELQTSITGHADEIASAASLVMGQSDEGTPVVVVRGLKWRGSIDAKAADLLRRPSILTPELVRMV
jgi:coenzyme F420-0:L-glutamate ligase/coenzyme F420-1:gamma-L-glutamate ligase